MNKLIAILTGAMVITISGGIVMTIFGPSLQGLNNNTASLADQGCTIEINQCTSGEISYSELSSRCQEKVQSGECGQGDSGLVQAAQNTYTTWFGS